MSHPFIGHNPDPPNNGKKVDSILDLEEKKIDYISILKNNGLLKLNNIKLKISSDIPCLVIDQTWSILDIITKCPPIGWIDLFKNTYNEFLDINNYLQSLTSTYIPYKKNIFKIFDICPVNKVKVVILGQDPYATISKITGHPIANGIAFSVEKEDNIPPTLNNIYRVLELTVPNFRKPNHGDLSGWVKQGVFLLNTCLTVRIESSGSHKKFWAGFITRVFMEIAKYNPNCIYIFWGNEAQSMAKDITSKYILKTSHPSPLGCKQFMQSNHFNEVNMILTSLNKEVIDWQLY